jgi:hypothetical protein
VEQDEQRVSRPLTAWISLALSVGVVALTWRAINTALPGAEVIVFWGLAVLFLIVLLVVTPGTARLGIAACLLLVAIGAPFGIWWGRISVVEAPARMEVSALFPDDVVAWDDSDDHGWWYYTMNPRSDRDPRELCEAVHAAMVERFPNAIPGTGIVISRTGGRGAYCGMPDWWGHPQSAHSWDISPVDPWP